MRETIAIAVCLLTLCVVLSLSFLFAVRHNPSSLQIAENQSEAAPARNERGRALPVEPSVGWRVFTQQNCQNCHSLDGAGNPRSPLDGVGNRLNPAEMRVWITGTGIAAEKLPQSIQKRKQRYLRIPEEEMAALVEYLASPAPEP